VTLSLRLSHQLLPRALAALWLLGAAACGPALATTAGDAAANPDGKKPGAKIYK